MNKMNTFQNDHMFPSLNGLSSELSSFGRIADKIYKNSNNKNSRVRSESFDDTAVPKKKFPASFKRFLQFIPGNDCCPDCEVRVGEEGTIPYELMHGLPSKSGSCMPWAK